MVNNLTTNIIATNKKTINLQSKNQLLVNSLIFSGLGFIVVALLSIGYSYIIRNYFSSWLINSYYYTIASSVILVIASIAIFAINWTWSRNILNASWSIIVIAWITNILLMTAMLAPLITLIDNSELVFITIAVSGGIFVLIGILSYLLMKFNLQLALTKLMFIILGGVFILGIIFSFTFGFVYTNSISNYFLVFDICYLVVSLIMIALVFYSIKSSSEVFSIVNRTQQMKLSLYFGMSLLISYVMLLRVLLRLISFSRSN